MSPRRAADRPATSDVWLPVAFVATFVATGVPSFGWPLVIVLGTGTMLALAFWIAKGRFHLAGRQMLPLHLATTIAVHLHVYEELTQGFPSAMRQTFHSATFSDATFLARIVFAVPIIYMLAAIGLWFRRPFAEFLSYTLFFGPGLMEWAHYVLPLFRPEPYHYFPGMWTAWVPMIPGLTGLWWNVRRIQREEREGVAVVERRLAAADRRREPHVLAHRA